MESSSEFWTSAEEPDNDHWFLGTLATVKAPAFRTGGVLSLVHFLHPAGFATPRHVHDTEDEAFYVLSGSISGFCGDRTWSAGEGAFVWLPKGVPHGYTVDPGVPVRTLAITVPGGFDEFVAEVGEPALRHALPEMPQMPDIDTLLAAAAENGQRILGPPPTVDL
jgi:mannose-6-phosphate isomerase-like protein (cupin superfamily)